MSLSGVGSKSGISTGGQSLNTKPNDVLKKRLVHTIPGWGYIDQKSMSDFSITAGKVIWIHSSLSSYGRG